MKFPSPAAREKFAEDFEKYHESHDHDGEVPRFEMVKASDIKSYERGAKDYDAVTIDGYAWYEIKEYHNREYPDTYTHYHIPTCCVSPIIVLESEFIDSGTLERHELSSIFGDMPDDDFESLMRSVKEDGFMDYVIRMHEGKILDGWHRYRAALVLNLVRKLMFYPWDEEKEGTAVAFVAARNIERRHLSASQRAQIVVSLNERFGWGGDRSKTPNDALKTKAELAAQAKVGTSTIDRAVKVEKLGKSESVIAGKKSASKVIADREAEKLAKRKKQVCKLMWDTRQDATRIYIGDGDTDLNKYLTLPQLEKGFLKYNPVYAEAFESAMQRTSFFSFQNFMDKVEKSEIDIEDLEKEYRALQTYVGDLRQWEREDWSPDTNWIQAMIQAKKDAESKSALKPEPEPEPEPKPEPDDLDTLWEKVTAEIEVWKQRHTSHVTNLRHVTQAHVIKAYRYCYGDRNREGEATAEELSAILESLIQGHMPLILGAEQAWRNSQNPGQIEPEPDDLNTLWEKVTAQMPKWKQKYKESGYKESERVSRASKSMLIKALRLYRESEGSDAATIEELKDLLYLLKSQSYPFIRKVRDVIRETEPAESEDPEADTSLVDLNLPTMKAFLDTLLNTVGQVENQIDRDNLCVSVYEAFDEYEEITEREQLSILIDCAYTLVSESEANA